MNELNTKAGFVALLGPTNAGKSTLLNTLVEKKVSAVSPKPQMTRHRILGILHRGNAELVFVDSPGFEGARRNGALAKFLKQNLFQAGADVDVVTLVLDAERTVADENYLKEAIQMVGEGIESGPHVVILNKIDRIEHDALLPTLGAIGAALAAAGKPAAEIVPVSAVKKRNLDELLRTLEKFLPEGPFGFPPEMDSDASETFLASEIIREKLYLYLQQELPYSVAVSVEMYEEDGNLLRIGAVIVVERDSQKGIVIGKNGEMLKKVGTAARKDLEARHGRKVFLQLHVRVVEEWTKTEDGLRRAGVA